MTFPAYRLPDPHERVVPPMCELMWSCSHWGMFEGGHSPDAIGTHWLLARLFNNDPIAARMLHDTLYFNR